MATRIYFRITQTHPRANLGKTWVESGFYYDMSSTAGTVPRLLTNIWPGAAIERVMALGGPTAKLAWWSERIASEVTLSAGTISCNLWGKGQPATRLRLKMAKITAGGSDVVTDLAQGDATTDLTTTDTAFPVSMTLPQSVTLAPGERLIFRVFVFRPDGNVVTDTDVIGQDFGYDGPSGGADHSWVEFTETVTWLPNTTTLSLRRTTGTGIGNFMDLLPTFGSTAFATAIVNTVSGLTDRTVGGAGEVVWTKTAGGIMAEWITPRLKSQWDLIADSATGKSIFGTGMSASESATAANIELRVKVFVRRPSGAETLVWSADPTSGTELTTTMTNYAVPAAATYSQQSVGEDDRIVVRVYIIPAFAATMGGSRTGSFGYDGVGPVNAVGSSTVRFYDMPLFKAEGDPAKSNIVPSGQSQLGVSNGQ